jgi:ferredoxin-NADP reductase
LRVVSKTAVAEDVMALALAGAAGERLPDWTPGAHIDLVLPTGLTKQYSLCGDRYDPYSYQVAVLRERNGHGGSAYVHDCLQPGDILGLGGPRNNFGLVPAERYLFIAGGIGITPLLPMIAQAEQLGVDWRLLYGGRRRSSLAYVDLLAGYGERVQLVPQDELGLLDVPIFLGAPNAGTKIYCCGPAPLLDVAALACGQWPPYSLRTERFVAKDQAELVRTTSFEVVLQRSGITVTVPPGTSILRAVADAGVEVLSSCRQGTCGTCETTVLQGTPDHRDSLLNDEERLAGDCMFICVSGAANDRLVLEL